MTTAREILDAKQSEAQFAAAFEDLLRLKKLLFYHTRRSTGSQPGFPDYVIISPCRECAPGEVCNVLFVELKSEAGKLTSEQERWEKALKGLEDDGFGCVRYRCWRPSDWDSIVKEIG